MQEGVIDPRESSRPGSSPQRSENKFITTYRDCIPEAVMLASKIRSEAPLTGPFLMRSSRESEKDVFDAGMFIDPPEAHRYPSSGCDHNRFCHVSRTSAAHDGALPPGTGEHCIGEGGEYGCCNIPTPAMPRDVSLWAQETAQNVGAKLRLPLKTSNDHHGGVPFINLREYSRRPSRGIVPRRDRDTPVQIKTEPIEVQA